MRSDEPVSRGRRRSTQIAARRGRQLQRRTTRPRTRQTHLGNPMTPPDYAGSRERDPNPEPTASLDQTPGQTGSTRLSVVGGAEFAVHTIVAGVSTYNHHSPSGTAVPQRRVRESRQAQSRHGPKLTPPHTPTRRAGQTAASRPGQHPPTRPFHSSTQSQTEIRRAGLPSVDRRHPIR